MSGHDRDPPSASELRAFACRLLGQREYSAAELSRRLRLKWPGLEPGPEATLLEALAAENLLSDARFTESLVRSQVQRLQGPLKIRAALRERGVADALIALELERYSDQWSALAARWLDRRHSGPLDFDARQKYYRRLINRGFTHDQAMDALNRSS